MILNIIKFITNIFNNISFILFIISLSFILFNSIDIYLLLFIFIIFIVK